MNMDFESLGLALNQNERLWNQISASIDVFE